ncbi:MAG TPA: hypothetical protein VGO57_15370 [Verrucomicrobiae bacterium]|jgi:hypothetical protein
MLMSTLIFFAGVSVLLTPIIGVFIYEYKIKSLMAGYLSPVQISILKWQARKPAKWTWLSAFFPGLLVSLQKFLPKPMNEVLWIALGIYVVVAMIFQYSNPCSDLPKTELTKSFIQRLAFLRRMQIGLVAATFALLIALIGMIEFVLPHWR